MWLSNGHLNTVKITVKHTMNSTMKHTVKDTVKRRATKKPEFDYCKGISITKRDTYQ